MSRSTGLVTPPPASGNSTRRPDATADCQTTRVLPKRSVPTFVRFHRHFYTLRYYPSMSARGRGLGARGWADLVLYMFRPMFYWNALWPLVGWEVGRRGGPPAATFAFGAAMALGAGVLFVLNDVADAGKDQQTAPRRPFAADIITPGRVLRLVGVAAAIAVPLLWLGTKRAEWVVLLLLAFVAAGVLGLLYSLAKPFGLLASLVYALIPSQAAVVAWWVRGHRDAATLALVLADLVLVAVAHNSLAALNDIEDDPKVGNRTLPVRVGAARTIWLIRALEVGSGFVLCALWAHLGRSALFFLVLVPVWARNVRDLRRLRTVFSADHVGRAQGIPAVFSCARSNQAHLLLAVVLLSWRVGLAASITLAICDCLQKLWIRWRFGQWSLPRGD